MVCRPLGSSRPKIGEYTPTGDGVPNLFGLTEFDGKTQFFDAGTYALPQVSLMRKFRTAYIWPSGQEGH